MPETLRMNWLLPWLNQGELREGDRSLVRDLRTGRAGAPLRIGLSLVAAAGLVSVPMFMFGVIDQGGRISNQVVAMGLALAGATWCVSLAWLWSSYRKWRRLIATICTVLGIWLVAIPVCVIISEVVRNESFLIAGPIFLGVSATIGTIVVNAHYATRGRPLEDASGAIAVVCPQCRYSLVGLESCQCPECGASYTVDRLIKEQDYALLRRIPHDETEIRAVPALPPRIAPADATNP